MNKPKATPYSCVLCKSERGCGFRGVLRFPNAEVPTCDHHEEKDVPMVPSTPRS